jgi:uncharacterized protein (TIGR00369 family)
VRFAEQFGDMTVPFHEYAGMTIEVGSPATVTVPLGDSIRGAFNPLHGGIAASLADVACATALTSELGAGKGMPVTTDLHVRFYRQPKEGPVTARAEIVHRGSKMIGTECSITDGLGRLLARASVTFLLVPLPVSEPPES